MGGKSRIELGKDKPYLEWLPAVRFCHRVVILSHSSLIQSTSISLPCWRQLLPLERYVTFLNWAATYRPVSEACDAVFAEVDDFDLISYQ